MHDRKASRSWNRPAFLIAAVVLAAVVMGLPTLRGGFVGGDDHRLVIDHVLVNRPSIDHAIKLFTIVHRDLYQPLPLLMFSAEFAIARALGQFQAGPQGGAWLFHLTNIVLHAVITLLVWRTVRILQIRAQPPLPLAEHQGEGTHTGLRTLPIATLAALCFAIHPLNVEAVAWVNGRMMLLSTLFCLGSVLAMVRWLDRARWIDAVLVFLCTLLSALSKVRVGLPLLLLLVAMMRSDWRRLHFYPVWIAAGAITAVFAWINIGATSQADLFSEAAEHLLGPRTVRVLLALDHYFTHMVWPAGLTSYYPTPSVVAWSDPQTLRAAIRVGIAALFLVLSAWHVPVSRWGIAWFFIALADTLPFIPARNVVAADRYVYLPLVGLFWALAAVAVRVFDHFVQHRKTPAPLARTAVTMLLAILIPLLTATSWYTARWYDTPELKTERVARVFPDVPRVWERYGWTLYSNGQYEKAIELAQREFVHDIPAVRSAAHQLIGMARFKQGRIDEAMSALHKALEIDPENDVGRFRLALVYDELGRFNEALPLYEACVRSAPSNNPTLHRTARVYRELGRLAEARALYEQELRNNPYEAPATLALADLDFQEGTPQSLQAARQRLTDLLEWMPDNTWARVNLAHLYDTIGQPQLAREQYDHAWQLGFENVDQAALASDFLEKQGDLAVVRDLWLSYTQSRPGDAAGQAFLAWSLMNADNATESQRQVAGLGAEARSIPMAQATVAMLAVDDRRADMVQMLGERVAISGDAALRRRMLRALERYDVRTPGNPWTYFLTTLLLKADGQIDAARAFSDLFSKHCTDPQCMQARSYLDSPNGTSPPTAP